MGISLMERFHYNYISGLDFGCALLLLAVVLVRYDCGVLHMQQELATSFQAQPDNLSILLCVILITMCRVRLRLLMNFLIVLDYHTSIPMRRFSPWTFFSDEKVHKHSQSIMCCLSCKHL